MSRSLLVASLAVALIALLAPATAQVPTNATVAFADVPANTVTSADAQSVSAFKVTFTISNLVCLGPNGATFTVNVSATTGNGTGNATVNQAVLTFNVPPGQGGAQAYSATQNDFVTVRPNNGTTEAVVVPVHLTAEVGSISGCATGTCCPAGGPGADFKVNFTHPAGYTGGATGEVVPGFGIPALVGALALVVIVLRRKA